MGRVQLALNVTDVDKAVEFYSQVFGAQPAKRREGYANFALTNPPLKLVLIESTEGGTLNHLGVEVATSDEVAAAADRLAESGLATFSEENVACCYARQDKVWVHDPDGAPWEVYTVLADAPEAKMRSVEVAESGCCAETGTSTDEVSTDEVSTDETPAAAACC